MATNKQIPITLYGKQSIPFMSMIMNFLMMLPSIGNDILSTTQ